MRAFPDLIHRPDPQSLKSPVIKLPAVVIPHGTILPDHKIKVGLLSNSLVSESGVLLTLDPGRWIGDKGYVGNDMITPIRKPAHRKLMDWEKEFNKQVNKIRYVIEQASANFKTRDHAYRLPPTARNVYCNYLNCNLPALLRGS